MEDVALNEWLALAMRASRSVMLIEMATSSVALLCPCQRGANRGCTHDEVEQGEALGSMRPRVQRVFARLLEDRHEDDGGCEDEGDRQAEDDRRPQLAAAEDEDAPREVDLTAIGDRRRQQNHRRVATISCDGQL